VTISWASNVRLATPEVSGQYETVSSRIDCHGLAIALEQRRPPLALLAGRGGFGNGGEFCLALTEARKERIILVCRYRQ
jgi:hypothetical protein